MQLVTICTYSTCVKNWYQFFTCVRYWYQFFTCVRYWYQFFTRVRNWYQFFTRQKLSTCEIWAQILPPKIYRNWPYVNLTFCKCDVLVPILLMGVKFTKCEIYGSTKLLYRTYNLLHLHHFTHMYSWYITEYDKIDEETNRCLELWAGCLRT